MKRYEALNGIRAIACICIVLMHVLANVNYTLDNKMALDVISSFTNFVFVFMTLSSFSMCCGYYQKIKENKVSIENFYGRRIKKILPFFSILLLINILSERTLNTVIEAFANFTLMFGFLQKDITVLGVAWFIGLIFIFYFIFPFFVYLFYNKKRAWITTIVALLMNLSCVYYFDVNRINMFYSFIYFCIGGLLYLYKNNIISLLSKNRIVSILFVIGTIILYYIIPDNKYLFIIKMILVCISLISYAISFDTKILDNKFTKFIGEMSLEIYLSHMVIFRIIEKINIVPILPNIYFSYILTCLIVIVCTILFAKIFRFIWKKIEKKVLKIESFIS